MLLTEMKLKRKHENLIHFLESHALENLMYQFSIRTALNGNTTNKISARLLCIRFFRNHISNFFHINVNRTVSFQHSA